VSQQTGPVLRASSDPRPIPVATATGAFLIAWVLAQVAASVVLAASGHVGDDAPIGVLGAALVAAWSVSLTAVVVASRRAGSGRPDVDVGLSFRSVDALGIPIGVLSQLVLVTLIYVPLQRLWPGTFSDDNVQRNVEDLVGRAGGATTVLLFALVVVGAPFVEEIVYRGMLQRAYLARFGEAVVVVGVAFVFAALHFRPVEFAGLFAFGIVLGLCGSRTGRIGLPIVAHMAFNATGLILAF
jgi:hypothetical protein